MWLNQDSRDEPDEVFTVTLSSPKGATIERDEGTMTIIDDDLGRWARARIGMEARR